MRHLLGHLPQNNDPILPLFHSPNTEDVYRILETRELKSKKARGEFQCVYFFYAKPSYSFRGKSQQFRPFSFIVDTADTHRNQSIIEIYFFDTGD